jgi:hypothetical protein
MLSARKLKATMFWDRKGGLMAEFMQQGITVTSDVYSKTLSNKRCGMLTSSVVLLHTNAQSYTKARTRTLLEHLNWKLFDYSHYSPYLSPSNYHLFTPIPR